MRQMMREFYKSSNIAIYMVTSSFEIKYSSTYGYGNYKSSVIFARI